MVSTLIHHQESVNQRLTERQHWTFTFWNLRPALWFNRNANWVSEWARELPSGAASLFQRPPAPSQVACLDVVEWPCCSRPGLPLQSSGPRKRTLMMTPHLCQVDHRFSAGRVGTEHALRSTGPLQRAFLACFNRGERIERGTVRKGSGPFQAEGKPKQTLQHQLAFTGSRGHLAGPYALAPVVSVGHASGEASGDRPQGRPLSFFSGTWTWPCPAQTG